MQEVRTANGVVSSDPIPRIEAAFVNRIGQTRYALWFPPNAKFLWLGHELVVVYRNAYFQEWADEAFAPALREAIAEVLPDTPTRFVQDAALFEGDQPAKKLQPQVQPQQSTPAPKPAPTAPQLNLFGEPAAPKLPKKLLTEPRNTRKWKTFAEFAVGPSNRVALAAAQAVMEEPGLGPNPLVLHGPVGTGKTHLLEAIYSGMRKQGDARPVFVTAEEFTHRFVQGTRFNKMTAFRKQFRECSALLLDDLNFLAGKRGSLEEFLYTLDSLVSEGRQVVVTTDCHPRLAEELMPELVDRLLGGVACSLLPPDDETRLDILRRKSLNSQIINDDVLKYLARNLKGNVRELEGALNSVRHFAKVTGQPVTISLAREAIGDLLRHTVRAITIADIDNAVCRLLNLSTGTLQSKSRSWQVSHPRMLAIFLSRKHTTATYGEIAKHFGVRQHSTAVAAEKNVRQWIAKEEPLALGDRKWQVRDLLERLEREVQK